MIESYPFTAPNIPSAGVYYFSTHHEVDYEVRFGRKRDNLLSATIVFGVRNEEYEGEEYVLTNNHNLYRVMATIQDSVMDFREKNPNVRSFEFTGEPRADEKGIEATKRIRVFLRYVHRTFDNQWDVHTDGNKVTIKRHVDH